MKDLNIRVAVEQDVSTILKFVKALAHYEQAEHEVVATEEMLTQFLFDEPRYASALILECEREAVGFALYFFSFSTWLGRPGLYLEDLYVDPDYRNRGIGKAVLVYLAQIAVAQGCGRFEWSVLDWNEPSIRFYEKLGAKPQREWVQYRVSGQALADLAATV
ncbi:MAG: GNAT family N-acetyltransferase [Arenicellales bacterium]|nr:GNAT family N-acetyltransferase [Arenicellales bacterium]